VHAASAHSRRHKWGSPPIETIECPQRRNRPYLAQRPVLAGSGASPWSTALGPLQP